MKSCDLPASPGEAAALMETKIAAAGNSGGKGDKNVPWCFQKKRDGGHVFVFHQVGFGAGEGSLGRCLLVGKSRCSEGFFFNLLKVEILGWGFCSGVAVGAEAPGGAPEPAPITASGTLPVVRVRSKGARGAGGALAFLRGAGGEEEGGERQPGRPERLCERGFSSCEAAARQKCRLISADVIWSERWLEKNINPTEFLRQRETQRLYKFIYSSRASRLLFPLLRDGGLWGSNSTFPP